MASSVSGEFVHSPEDGRVESAALRRSPLIECVEYATTATVAGRALADVLRSGVALKQRVAEKTNANRVLGDSAAAVRL
jgi:hypothetical protein